MRLQRVVERETPLHGRGLPGVVFVEVQLQLREMTTDECPNQLFAIAHLLVERAGGAFEIRGEPSRIECMGTLGVDQRQGVFVDHVDRYERFSHWHATAVACHWNEASTCRHLTVTA